MTARHLSTSQRRSSNAALRLKNGPCRRMALPWKAV
jgi:hypothetical protein